MSQSIPVGVPSDGMVKIAFAPAIADPNVPSIAELGAATAVEDISCWLTAFGTTAEEATREVRRICSKQTFTDYGTISYGVDDLVYVYDAQNPASETNEVYAALVPGTTGFLVLAWGKDAEEDWAPGDIVDVYPVRLGAQRKQTPEANSELTVAQKPYVTGNVVSDVPLVA